MALNERKILVLKHVVEEYVRTNRPVGSDPVAKLVNLSSATVRNTMNELLSEGHIMQPHTSAGRVPTDAGYRFFVDYLLEEYRLAEAEGEAVQTCLDELHIRLDRMLSDMTGLLSGWSDCLAFVTVPELERCEVESIAITRVSSRRVLLILVLSNGMVENRLITLPADTAHASLERIVRRLNDKLHARSVSEISQHFLESVFSEIRLTEMQLCQAILSFFESLIFSFSRRVFIDGAEDIMNQPEFHDTTLLRPVLEAVKSDNTGGIFSLPSGARLPEFMIGAENPLREFSTCSVIKSHFTFGDRTAGTVGIIGPRRMNYSRLSSLVSHIAGSLSRSLAGFTMK